MSHQETARVFERALIRAGVKLWYSEGFNPHPKITLPLPRSVGLQTNCDLICMQVKYDQGESVPDSDTLCMSISKQLPEGIEIVESQIYEGVAGFNPEWVDYQIFIKQEFREKVLLVCENIQSSLNNDEKIEIERVNPKKKIRKMITVNDYLSQLNAAADSVVVRCVLSDSGSMRVDEILLLLGLEPGMLVGPVVRKEVCWTRKK